VARQPTSPLSSVFVSDAVLQIMVALSLRGSSTPSEIQPSTRVTLHVLRKELRRLLALGLVTVATGRGNTSVYSLSTDPLVANFEAIAMAAYGPVPVIAEEFSGMEKVEKVYIFGSWAARHNGIPGRLPNDIDVVVVGDVTRTDMYEASENATQKLGREVSARRVSTAVWENQTDPFLQEVANGPLVEVPLVIS
jgi:predicted nucleotidyltransferase